MRIIQVATLVTPDGAYGGPVRVAVNQTRALLNAGHDVVFAAGARGYGSKLPDEFDGVPAKLFQAPKMLPQPGFASVMAPGLQKWLKRHIDTADVVHIHMSRDLVTLPSARLAARRHVPYVLQTHGMIGPSGHRLAAPLDWAWTRPALKNAERIFYLTEKERSSLESIEPEALRLQELHNGVPDFPDSSRPEVADSIEVLFLARLHMRKRPLMFIEMAKKLHSQFPQARFVLVGPDEGEGKAVRASIENSDMGEALRWEGPVPPEMSAERISQSDIYVLPSVDEPFPMSVLEAMGLGKPVVVTDTCGLADTIADNKAGHVVDASLPSLISAVERLLSEPLLRREMSINARSLVTRKFGMNGVVENLEKTYEEVSRHRKP